jgi:AbrB family looped-hinge helix DNA binding protein
MGTSTVTQKGQIVIPAPLRRKLGFEPGTKVIVTEGDEGEIRVRPLNRAYFEQYAGLLSDGPSATEELLETRARDRRREASSDNADSTAQ